MNEFKENINKVMEKYKISKKAIYITLIIIAILLLLLSEFLPKEKPKNNNANKTFEEIYILKTEEKITKLLSNIDGVGKTEVMVTLETGQENIYAFETKSNNNEVEDVISSGRKENQNQKDEQMTVIRDQSGGESPVLITTKDPVIKGVAVICQGGDKTLIKQSVTDVVTTVLNVSSNRVCVIKKS